MKGCKFVNCGTLEFGCLAADQFKDEYDRDPLKAGVIYQWRGMIPANCLSVKPFNRFLDGHIQLFERGKQSLPDKITLPDELQIRE